MNSELILFALNDMDDEFIEEATQHVSWNSLIAARNGLGACSVSSVVAGSGNRRRRLRTALIAACLILVFCAAAYAAGVFTADFNIFRSRDTHNTNSVMNDGQEQINNSAPVNAGSDGDASHGGSHDPSDNAYTESNLANQNDDRADHSGMINIDGEWIDSITITAMIQDAGFHSLEGPIKEEAPKVLLKCLQEFYEKESEELIDIFHEMMDADEKYTNHELSKDEYNGRLELFRNKMHEWSVQHPAKEPIEYMGCECISEGQYHKTFNTQQEAAEYLGFKGYEAHYFPFGESVTDVMVCGGYFWDGKGATELQKPEGFSISMVWVFTKGSRDGIDVSERAELQLHSGPGQYFMGGIADNGKNDVQLFTTTSGYNGSRVSPVEGASDDYHISGMLVKDNCVYHLRISCDWEKKGEAEIIFKNWTESF